MNDAMNDVIDSLRKEIAMQARDPEEAQLLTLKALGKLAGTNWQPYFEQMERDSLKPCLDTTVEQRLNEMVKAAIETQLNQLKAQPAQEVPKPAKKASGKIVPRDLPPGTMFARDFYEKYNVSYSNFRRHTEKQGINGDLLEVVERRPYPNTRPNYKDRYLTPEQQKKAIAYWIEHGTPYTVPESDQE